MKLRLRLRFFNEIEIQIPSIVKLTVSCEKSQGENNNKIITRMHSSRMRTVRSSGRISGGVPGGRGCTWSQGVYLVWGVGVYLVWGGVPGPGGAPGLGGCTWSRGCTWSGSVPGLGGVYLVPGVYLVRYSPPCGQTHACKNITFATSLRTVIIN